MKIHDYEVNIEWTGNTGKGTLDYTSYSRDHRIKAEHKNSFINGSSDPSFRGDKSRYNPEELFLSSLSSCHMLWYLHLCAKNGIVVTKYSDYATGKMIENKNGSGNFESVTLHPKVVISDSRIIEEAMKLHNEATRMCFIANSCNFKIYHLAEIIAD